MRASSSGMKKFTTSKGWPKKRKGKCMWLRNCNKVHVGSHELLMQWFIPVYKLDSVGPEILAHKDAFYSPYQFLFISRSNAKVVLATTTTTATKYYNQRNKYIKAQHEVLSFLGTLCR